jgi:hypothetical protein
MRTLSGHAFISYVREDSLNVDRLQRTLEAAGIPVWRDTADLWPGENWRAKVRYAISENALAFIACFSSRSLARQRSYQNEELLLAVDQLRQRRPDDPWLIPVRFDDCEIPDLDLGGGRTLASLQRSDLFGDRDVGAARLVVAVLRILGNHNTDWHPRMHRVSAQPDIRVGDGKQETSVAGYRAVDDGRRWTDQPSSAVSQNPIVVQGRRSKVLELNLPPGTYCMSWRTEGKGLFIVRHESGRKGEGDLVVTAATPDTDSGEQIVRITEKHQLFSVHAPQAEWVLNFLLLIAAAAPPPSTPATDSQSVLRMSGSSRRSLAIFEYKMRQAGKCTNAMTALINEYTSCLGEATSQFPHVTSPHQYQGILDRLATHISPIVDQYAIQSARCQRFTQETDQLAQEQLRRLKAISRQEWTDSTPRFLESVRSLAEARLHRLNMLMKMHDNASALIGRSDRLDSILRKFQSAIIIVTCDRGTIMDLLKDLEVLGY